ncbi:hypothetical protein C8R44DRAFT_886778 [Mycena epipterygia]|nr:hypothetical protein C8R44DRAFT_886778 [Mycena epipterygia]
MPAHLCLQSTPAPPSVPAVDRYRCLAPPSARHARLHLRPLLRASSTPVVDPQAPALLFAPAFDGYAYPHVDGCAYPSQYGRACNNEWYPNAPVLNPDLVASEARFGTMEECLEEIQSRYGQAK